MPDGERCNNPGGHKTYDDVEPSKESSFEEPVSDDIEKSKGYECWNEKEHVLLLKNNLPTSGDKGVEE